MSKSILVLEENSVVHGLVASALDMDGLTLHHEFNPAKYVDRARTLQPDLILFSNADQGNNYAILKQLKTLSGLGKVPLVLLANSRDRVDLAQIKSLNVAALVRKPFEASDLQLQVSKHLDLIDLVGSAYEYNRSQSVRDEGINPLTQLDVLDPEVTALMHDSNKGGAPQREVPVPDVDFSAELSTEPEAGLHETRQTFADTAGARAAAAAGVTASRGGLEVLDDGPVEAFSAGAPEPLAGEDVLLDEDELLAPLGPAATAQPAKTFEDADIEELGPEDLLEEEAYEEATFAPAGVEQTIQPAPASGQAAGTRLDEIEVELSDDDLNFAAMEAAPEALDVSAAAEAVISPAAPTPGELPDAVRRMMELRPVFSKAPDAAALEPEPEPLAEPLGSGRAIESMVLGNEELDEAAILEATEHGSIEELAPLDSSDPDLLGLTSSEDIDLESAEAEADLAPLSATPEQDDQDLTIDSDEEELILSSLDEEEEPAPMTGALELTPEEREGLTEALDLEQEIFQPAPETVATVAEARAEARAEATVTMTRAVVEPPLPPAEIEPIALEEVSLGAGDAIAKADLEEMELLDDLSLQEPAAPAQADVPEEEQFLTATFQNVQPAARVDSQFGLELPTDELLEVPVPEDLAGVELESEVMPAAAPDVTLDETTPAEEPLPEPAGLTEEMWNVEMDSTQTTDMSMFETKESAAPVEADMAAETMETAAQEQAAPLAAATSASSGGVSESFEDAFAALKEEIESNPEGERLDDILKMEQLQDEVAKLEFTIPQHEHALARGMPLTALPEAAPMQAAARAPAGAARTDAAAMTQRVSPASGSAPGAMAAVRQETRASSTVTTTVTTKTTAAVQRTEAQGVAESTRRDLGLAATGSLLDDSARARLGQILDEIISTSVRKAVREEMPRLMERIARETDPSAPA